MNYWGTLLFLLAALAVAGERQLVILQTSDVHGRIEYGDDKQGWLKISTVIEQERKKAKGRCLYIDCGDSIQGTFSAAQFRGEPSIAALNYLKPDVWIPGNHEFDFGVRRLIRLIDTAEFPVLNGNVEFTHPPKAVPQAYRMIALNRLRVAIIGMNTGLLKSWFWGTDYSEFSVKPAVECLEKILPTVQSQYPNLIVLAIHQGLLEGRASQGEISEICKRFPQIDLILGGHTHAPIPGKRLWGSYVVQPGEHGEFVSRVTVTFDQRRKVKLIQSTLLDATTVKPDMALRKQLKPYIDKEKATAFEVVAKSSVEVSSEGTPGVNNSLSDLFCRAILAETEADCVLHGLHNEFSWKKGNVQRWQIFTSLPYENRICIVELNKQELKAILEEQLQKKPREHMLGFYGIKAYVGKDKKTVTEIEMPVGQQTLKMALTDFAVAGGGWRFPILRKTLEPHHKSILETTVTTRTAVENYLKSTENWNRPPQNWLVFQTK